MIDINTFWGGAITCLLAEIILIFIAGITEAHRKKKL